MSDEKEAKIQHSVSIPLAPAVEESKQAEESPKNKGGRPAGLTKKARCFLELILAGKDTKEAYNLAGYEGSDESAWHLRSVLRDQLYAMLKTRGMSREGILMQLRKGFESPTEEELAGKPLNFDQKLQLMKFLAKLTPEKDMLEKPKVTPFLLNIENAEGVTVTGGPTSGEQTEDLA